MLFAIIARDKADGLERRMATRPAHLEHLSSLGEKLCYAGPVLDGEDFETPRGSLLIVEAANLDEARALIEADPFFAAGVFESVELLATRSSVGKWSH